MGDRGSGVARRRRVVFAWMAAPDNMGEYKCSSPRRDAPSLGRHRFLHLLALVSPSATVTHIGLRAP